MGEEITICKAETKDHVELRKLQDLTREQHIVDGEHAWQVWIRYCDVMKAVSDDKIVGAALGFPTKDNRVLVHQVFVHPEHTNKGIGTKLLSELLKQNPGKDHFLTTGTDNDSAKRVYEKCGFEQKEFIKGYYRPEEDRYVYEKPKGQ
jgi:ribosomal protein S18 acetylase RimI-like enzyme|tara:strand:+ start:775 stop:1218 length:444 start_codon:yes stop_codon:yes gene_type:complete